MTYARCKERFVRNASMVGAGKTLLNDATSMGICTSRLSRAAGEVGRGSGREGAVMKHGKLCKSRLLVMHPLPALRGRPLPSRLRRFSLTFGVSIELTSPRGGREFSSGWGWLDPRPDRQGLSSDPLRVGGEATKNAIAEISKRRCHQGVFIAPA